MRFDHVVHLLPMVYAQVRTLVVVGLGGALRGL
ncbi:hypothetical protein M878_19435 [Streptomyces roseochromogenus subsp. oscitans DS 12.976]|uniref:Uncharacterized protein n=1 Tax=Streptomyces roseochromogenus subsp. oscitans DS 12.976 TaxID=1352936 RepID=V6KD11_STRRC|nr:hypothetical protein M878_19435 [Streptomyces roseochromogenus subsp. oscitans DS 12.976]